MMCLGSEAGTVISFSFLFFSEAAKIEAAVGDLVFFSGVVFEFLGSSTVADEEAAAAALAEANDIAASEAE